MTGPILLVIGVVALFAAIVGGGIKFKDIEVGTVKSLWRQGLLGIFGIIVSLIGLVLVIDPNFFNDSNSADQTQNTASPDQTNVISPETTTNDSSIVDQNAPDANNQPASDNNSSEAATQQPSPS